MLSTGENVRQNPHFTTHKQPNNESEVYVQETHNTEMTCLLIQHSGIYSVLGSNSLCIQVNAKVKCLILSWIDSGL